MDLLSRYGRCIIPKNSVLYRMGAIDADQGAFFALHPFWANNFHVDTIEEVEAWKVGFDIEVLFAVKYIEWNGLPICALSDIYRDLIDSKSNLDELAVKSGDLEAKSKLLALLETQRIQGWLTTMENSRPLEIFLCPKALLLLSSKAHQVSKTARRQNTLHKLHILPAASFFETSGQRLADDFYFARLGYRGKQAADYSLFEKLYDEGSSRS